MLNPENFVSCRAQVLFFNFRDERLPIDDFGVGPQAFQVVQVACFGQEGMHDDVAPVLQDPRTLFVAFCRRGLVSAGFHLNPYFVSQGVHLTSARARGDHKKVHDGRHASQIEDDGIFTAEFFAKFGDLTGVFQAALQPGLGGGIGDDGGNGDAPRGNLTVRPNFRRDSTIVLTTKHPINQRTH